MTQGVPGFIQRVYARREVIRQELGALGQLTGAKPKTPVERALGTVKKQFGESLLPDVSPESCQRAAGLVGFRALLTEPPAVGIEAERVKLNAEIAAIEADSTWQQRVALAHPETGTLTTRIAELEEQRRPALDVVSRCRSHPRFEQLVASGYDTPTYSVPFWRSTYYQDWQAGDEVVERFGDREREGGPALRFRDVLALYTELCESLAALNPALDSAQQQLQSVERLVQARADALSALETLEQRHLAKWRARLVSHVEALGLEHQDPTLLAVPELARQVKVIDGLNAKLRCLADLHQSAEALAAELRKELDRLKSDETKYMRPKKINTRFTDEDLHKRFMERPAKVTKRVRALTETSRKVNRFDRWDDGRIGEPFDWLPLLMGAAAVYELGARDSEAAAATAAASTGGAGLLSRDAS